jgi:uncharacterized protein YkwD
MKFVFGFSLFLLFTSFEHTQKPFLTSEEQKLYDLLMDYRKSKNLPSIALSSSLTIVAQTHAKDLALNNPVKGRCNAHSWSDQGDWTECCYTSDHKNAECMWSKPAELTNYTGAGYEIAARYITKDPTIKMTAKEAIAGWKKSSGHNMVILNTSKWKTANWQAIGIGIYNGAACVWFGEEKDPN